MNTFECTAGCLFGLALGDALAAPVEFIPTTEEILRLYPPDGPQQPEGSPARVTDDTQMMLAVAEALACCGRPLTREVLEPALRDAFVRWAYSPDNDRAPGITCLTACTALAEGVPWPRATQRGSKGCGANMRVAPVGLLALPGAERSAVAMFQAALTHGHPTALAASNLTAAAIAFVAANAPPKEILPLLRNHLREQAEECHPAWLAPFWEMTAADSPRDYIRRGWAECAEMLDRVEQYAENQDLPTDPCVWLGEGWVAEEALGTALLCFLRHPDDPVAALRRAALSSGDSDSIAAITGALVGARGGLAGWPADWVQRVEYHDRILAASRALAC